MGWAAVSHRNVEPDIEILHDRKKVFEEADGLFFLADKESVIGYSLFIFRQLLGVPLTGILIDTLDP